MSPWLWFLAGLIGLGAVFLVLELLVRRRALGSELTRRFAHVAACLFALLVYATLGPWGVAVLGFGFALAMLASRALKLLTSIHNTRRRSLGEVYLPLGLGLAALLAAEDAALFTAATLVLGLSDVAAGLVGDLLDAHAKTWRGSAAFFIVTVIVLLACGYPPLVSGCVAVLVTFVERASPYGSDNITIPLATALLLMLSAT